MFPAALEWGCCSELPGSLGCGLDPGSTGLGVLLFAQGRGETSADGTLQSFFIETCRASEHSELDGQFDQTFADFRAATYSQTIDFGPLALPHQRSPELLHLGLKGGQSTADLFYRQVMLMTDVDGAHDQRA